MPTNTVARLVRSTGLRVSISVDTSGCGRRRSHAHHATSTIAPKAATPIVDGADHPHELPCVMVRRTADNPAARPAAPTQSIVPVELPVLAGMAATATAITTTTNPVVSQNTRW